MIINQDQQQKPDRNLLKLGTTVKKAEDEYLALEDQGLLYNAQTEAVAEQQD